MLKDRAGFSNTTVKMIAQTMQEREQRARQQFLSTGRSNDAEQWHQVRNACEGFTSWLSWLDAEEENIGISGGR